MIPTNRVEILQTSSSTTGLYESYYFRGNDQAGRISFWLKHNLLRFNAQSEVRIENTVVIFDHGQKRVQVFNKFKVLSQQEFAHATFSTREGWDDIRFELDEDCAFEISSEKVSGVLKSDQGCVAWDFKLSRSEASYFHYPRPWYYRGFFPKKKILTRDLQLGFSGSVVVQGKSVTGSWSGEFIGMNGHNWGREHAFKYLYGNCNEWSLGRSIAGTTPQDAYFDGFSAKILLGGIPSPFLSMGSLRWQGQWYHFNNIVRSLVAPVKMADLKAWEVCLRNATHELSVRIDGRESLWVSLEYDHPSQKKSIVNNTKNAAVELILMERSTEKEVTYLRSDRGELESLIP